MTIYVAHENKTTQDAIHCMDILRKLQTKDDDDLYLCPAMMLSYLDHDKNSCVDMQHLHYDMMSLCDAVFVASDGVDDEIREARRMNLEVYRVE